MLPPKVRTVLLRRSVFLTLLFAVFFLSFPYLLYSQTSAKDSRGTKAGTSGQPSPNLTSALIPLPDYASLSQYQGTPEKATELLEEDALMKKKVPTGESFQGCSPDQTCMVTVSDGFCSAVVLECEQGKKLKAGEPCGSLSCSSQCASCVLNSEAGCFYDKDCGLEPVCDSPCQSQRDGTCSKQCEAPVCKEGNCATAMVSRLCDAKLCSGFCESAKDCDDGNPCTDDSCSGNQCKHTNNTKGCDDGKYCTENDKCGNGVCSGGSARVCNDQNVCTDDSCDAATDKCLFKNNTKSCDDGNLCTDGDKCQSGGCVAGTEKICNDGVSCTMDSCLSSSGQCQFLPVDTQCNDGKSCTEDRCDPIQGCRSFVIDGCDFTAYSDSDCRPYSLYYCAKTQRCVKSMSECNCPSGTFDCGGSCVSTSEPCCSGGRDGCQCPAGKTSCYDRCLLPGEVCCDTSAECPVRNECEQTACSAHTCTYSSVSGCCPSATPYCPQTGTCLDPSICDPCTSDAQCINNTDSCKVPRCVNGGCSYTENAPEGPLCCYDGKTYCGTTGKCQAETCPQCITPEDCIEDSNLCTSPVQCLNNQCVYPRVLCSRIGEKCDPGTGNCGCPVGQIFCAATNDCRYQRHCEGCSTAADCDPPLDFCRDVTCNTAVHLCDYTAKKPSGTVCNDNNVCTQNEICNSSGNCVANKDDLVPSSTCCAQRGFGFCWTTGQCVTASASCPACTSAADCRDDGNLCTGAAQCVSGSCVYPPVTCDPATKVCDSADGKCKCPATDPYCDKTKCTKDADCPAAENLCVGQWTCNTTSGICVQGAPKNCNDGVSCTQDGCAIETGICVHEDTCPEGQSCDPKANQCLVCQDGYRSCDGQCIAEGSCCVKDDCGQAVGSCSICQATDRGCLKVCYQTDCVENACMTTAIEEPCLTAGACGCDPTVAGACDDGDPCNGAEYCDASTRMCKSGPPPNCDDGIACTQDICSSSAPNLCLHIDSCLDGKQCDTLTQICRECASGFKPCGGACIPQAGCCTAQDCDDGNACTNDICQANRTCSHTANSASCEIDDGKACTTGDYCAQGICHPGPVKYCSGVQQCTEPDGTCECPSGTEWCDTLGICTSNPCVLCQSDTDCNDENTCTDDACIEGNCQYSFNTASCSDSSACSLNDRCDGGVCRPGTSKYCPANKQCADPSGDCVCPEGLPFWCDLSKKCVADEASCAGCRLNSECDDSNP